MRHIHFFFSVLLCFSALLAHADDVGITETRLFEEEGNRYALEVDIPPGLVDSIQAPVLPERGSLTGEEERVHLGQMLVVRYRFSTGDRPLDASDQLLLPWQRTGAVVTAHWLDGKSKRAFFDRDLTGIPIPVSSLRAEELSRGAVFKSSVTDALSYLQTYWFLHLLLIIACAAQGSLRGLVQLIFAFAAGHGLSLIATDLGVPTVPQGLVTVLLAVTAIFMFGAACRKPVQPTRFWPVLMALGLLQGLSTTAPAEAVVARFGFNGVIDLAFLAVGPALWMLLKGLAPRVRSVMMTACGAFAALALFWVVPEASNPLPSNTVADTPFGAVPSLAKTTSTVSRPVELDDPLSGFVTITPFEIRCEWLIRASDFLPEVSVAPADFREDVLNKISSAMALSVDGRNVNPDAVRADYVSVGTYGVSTTADPLPEALEAAVPGITLAYAVDDAPQSVSVHLQPLEGIDVPVPVGLSDPWGATPHILTASDPTVDWTRRFAGFRRPVIPAVQIRSASWPVVSIVLLMGAGVLMIRHRQAAIMLCGAALLLYPFVRTPALIARAPAVADTQAALEQLLTNIYRAFDYRTEEAIYDRLAVSATGDQLAEIYLEQIRAMELENRGGARASVDNVEMQAVHGIRPTASGILVDAEWVVSGSVSHFGHTHYRKNRYSAVLRIVAEKKIWKIGGIEIKEEEREL